MQHTQITGEQNGNSMRSYLFFDITILAIALRTRNLVVYRCAAGYWATIDGQSSQHDSRCAGRGSNDTHEQAVVGALIALLRSDKLQHRQFAVDLLDTLLTDPSAMTGELADFQSFDALAHLGIDLSMLPTMRDLEAEEQDWTMPVEVTIAGDP